LKPSTETTGPRIWRGSLANGPFGFSEVNLADLTLSMHPTHFVKDKDSARRGKFILPPDPSPVPTPAGSSSGVLNREISLSTQPSSSQNLSTPTPPVKPTASQKSKSRPAASRKPKKSPPQPPTSGKSTSQEAASQEPASQEAASEESTLQLPTPRASLPTMDSTAQATGVSELPQDMPMPALVPPAPVTAVNPPSFVNPLNADGDEMRLFATALGVHQFLSQVAVTSPAHRVPSMVASESSDVVEPIQFAVNPLQLSTNPSQVAVEPSQPLPESQGA